MRSSKRKIFNSVKVCEDGKAARQPREMDSKRQNPDSGETESGKMEIQAQENSDGLES